MSIRDDEQTLLFLDDRIDCLQEYDPSVWSDDVRHGDIPKRYGQLVARTRTGCLFVWLLVCVCARVRVCV